MAPSLPPPGTSRPRPPLAPPEPEGDVDPPDVDGLPAPSPVLPPPPLSGAGRPIGPAPGVARHDDRLPPPEASTAWPSIADRERQRRAMYPRAILTIGYGLIALALGLIARTGWIIGTPEEWVWWASVVMAPAVLTAVAALFGWRYARPLALFAAAWFVVVALVVVVLQPAIGLPQVVCALAAVAVTVGARLAEPEPPAEGPLPVDGTPDPPVDAPAIGLPNA